MSGAGLQYQCQIRDLPEPLVPPDFVMSAFRAIMACLMRVTSAPPTYDALFISQFATTHSHGFGPLRCATTCSMCDCWLSLLNFLRRSTSFSFCWAHLTSSSLPRALRALRSSSSASCFLKS